MNKIYQLLPLLCVTALAGCASFPFAEGGRSATLPSDEYRASLQRPKAPRSMDIQAATALEWSRQDYVRAELTEAHHAATLGNDAAAVIHLHNVLEVDPGNFKAKQDLRRLERKERIDTSFDLARQYGEQRPQEALEILGRILSEQPNHADAKRLRDELLRASEARSSMYPQLSESLRKQVSLNFKSQQLASIFEAISRVSGVNFMFDSDVSINKEVSMFAEKTTAESAINLLLRTNQLERKVLDRNTLLVYPATPDKRRGYQDYAIRTFFLAHADAKAVVTALRQVVKPKDVYVDERVNAVVMRDTPDTINIAERIVMGLDIPQSEVTLDVQVLEVNMNDSLDLGVQYPGRLQFGAIPNAATGKLTLGELLRMNRDGINVSSESGSLALAIDMLQKQGKTITLANPKIRVRNLEKASIKIGERVPIVTTTNANGVVSESVSYQDVGLMLKVEPRISLNDEVSVKVDMEVSSILSQHTTKTGLVAYSLGTRNAQTLMTAKNSETQILAGLIKRGESSRVSGLPGLSGIPGIGRLFGSDGRSNEQSEIVLLITPHIERNLDLPSSAVTTFLTGTESTMTTETLTLEAATASGKPLSLSSPHSDQGPDLNAPIGPIPPVLGRASSNAGNTGSSASEPVDSPNTPSPADGVTHGMGMMRTGDGTTWRPAPVLPLSSGWKPEAPVIREGLQAQVPVDSGIAQTHSPKFVATGQVGAQT